VGAASVDEPVLNRYVKAGAKYFGSLAGHHDNFDNYDSTHRSWNSTNADPERSESELKVLWLDYLPLDSRT
jgi:hypothetical protein